MLNKTGKDYDLQEQRGYTDSEQHNETQSSYLRFGKKSRKDDDDQDGSK